LGISHSRGKLANQLWLLAEDVPPLLHGETFSRYILKDEKTNRDHPSSSGILYISLSKLAQEESPAGELASFLLGRTPEAKNETENETVKKITEAFNRSFNTFKSDKEVFDMLTLAERYKHEGFVEGIEIGELRGEERGITLGEARGITLGEARGINKIVELIKRGFSLDEVMREINKTPPLL
jgi:hypothetical protein